MTSRGRRSGSRGARRRGLPRELLYTAASFTVFFLAAEGLSRLLVSPPDVETRLEHEKLIEVLGLPALNRTMEFDPELFWRLKPELRALRVAGRIREHPISFSVTTHAGLRSAPVPLGKRRPRILAMGDSTTFGVGVEDGETWPSRLEELLRREGAPAEVVNAGVPGYTAFQGKVFLERRGLRMRPDVVVACFGFNDADEGMPSSDPDVARALVLRRWEAPLLLHSRFYFGIKRALGAWQTPRVSGKEARLSPDRFYETLGEIKALCDRAGARLVLLVWPYEGQVAARDPSLVEHQITAALFSRNEGVPLVSLVEAFIRDGRPLFLDHIHANSDGCRVAAEALLPFVR